MSGSSKNRNLWMEKWLHQRDEGLINHGIGLFLNYKSTACIYIFSLQWLKTTPTGKWIWLKFTHMNHPSCIYLLPHTSPCYLSHSHSPHTYLPSGQAPRQLLREPLSGHLMSCPPWGKVWVWLLRRLQCKVLWRSGQGSDWLLQWVTICLCWLFSQDWA